MNKTTLGDAGKRKPDSSTHDKQRNASDEARKEETNPAEETLAKEKRAEDRKETRAIDSTLPNE